MPLDATTWTPGLIALVLVVAVVALAVGFGLARAAERRRAAGIVATATAASKKLAAETARAAESEAEQLLATAEEELGERRAAWEEEEKRRRSQLGDLEKESQQRHRRLVDRDRALARRDHLLSEREREVEKRSAAQQRHQQELDRLEERWLLSLEELAGMTQDEARRQLLEELRVEVRQAAAHEVRTIKEEIQKHGAQEVQKILALAIERSASEYSSEKSVSYVKVPDPSLRGRIIGSEGRNIRAFEKLTGMQLILDENPEQIAISGFNPIRREVAVRSLTKLIEGGVIHPKKIQQVVASVERKIEQEIVRAGKEALRELKIRRMHPELVKLLGRLKYRTSYGQPVLEHVKEVAHLCGRLAAELRLDQKLAKRAALMHDIGKAVDFEREGTHPEIGGELARRYGEHEVVINAIESHHEDCEVIDPISVLVAAADSISGARPGARRRTAVDFARRVAKLEELATSFPGVDSAFALQAGREIRVVVAPKKIDDDAAALLAHDLSQRIQTEMDYPGRIKVNVIRSMRAQAVAR